MKKIALVPNDDGFGPSALGYYVAKTFLGLAEPKCSLVVMNQSAVRLNKSFYRAERKDRVWLEPVFGGIKLKKTEEGGVDLLGSFESVKQYPTHSDQYSLPEDVDCVVDVGTPAAVRAASRQGKLVFTVFDHSWAKTYEMLVSDFCQRIGSSLGVETAEVHSMIHRSALADALRRLKEDEGQTAVVFLFPEFITPPCYYEYWKSVGVEIEQIGGVFGGLSDDAMTMEDAQASARKFLGFENDLQTVYLLGGGTEVWDSKIPRIIDALKDKALPFNVAVFDRKKKVEPYERVGNSGNLSIGGPCEGRTIQGLLPAISLVITRAGGGIANDAIACRVPFVCFEEKGHRQVEMIREHCDAKA